MDAAETMGVFYGPGLLNGPESGALQPGKAQERCLRGLFTGWIAGL